METVEVFGQKYSVRSDEDRQHLEQVAELVDRHMREVAGSSKVISTTKVAVATAMNLASEFYRYRQEIDARQAALRERVDQLIEIIDRALAEASAGPSGGPKQKQPRASAKEDEQPGKKAKRKRKRS